MNNNPIIPNANNTNAFISTAPINYPQIASKIPSNINGLQSNIPTTNAFQNTQSYYVAQSQQKNLQ
jgi:hypothetical protein